MTHVGNRMDTFPIVTVVGDLAAQELAAWRRAVDPHLARGSSGIVLDLGRVRDIDGDGLRYLVHAGMTLEQQHRWLALAEARPLVEDAMRRLSLDSVLHLFPTISAAVTWLRQRAGQGTGPGASWDRQGSPDTRAS